MRLFIVFVFIFISHLSIAQDGEFTIYDNGLIYSEETMGKLEFIVDSLNLKFKSCDLDRKYYGNYQTIGYHIKVKKSAAKRARKKMQEGISFSEFEAQFPNAEIIKDQLIVRFEFENYEGNDVVEYSNIKLEDGYNVDIRIEDEKQLDYIPNAREWIFDDFLEYGLTAFYIPNNFNRQELPEKYARMVQYTSCMIDTTSLIPIEDEKGGSAVYLPPNLTEMTNEAKVEYLDEMRRTTVYGMCSQDDSPRVHAKGIAVLAAETTSWEIFLRAHLNIMNDRFQRASDGNYAWAQRKTYIKELEDLNINVSDLLFGISLRINDPAENHYYGSVSRVGRALSETNDPDKLEDAILSIIKDDDLDDFNRIVFYYLFSNYNYHLEDETRKKKNLKKLKEAVKLLPKELSYQIKFDN